mgnify:CR=1 FL=1
MTQREGAPAPFLGFGDALFLRSCLVIAVLRIVLRVPGGILRVRGILGVGRILHAGILAGIAGVAVVLALAVGIVCIVCHNDCLLY